MATRKLSRRDVPTGLIRLACIAAMAAALAAAPFRNPRRPTGSFLDFAIG